MVQSGEAVGMTDEQWKRLLAIIDGSEASPPVVGFISDSPWLPGWAGMSILDYYTSEAMWLEANLKQVREFPEVMFLPGFWAEYGMCTEPSAFGARCVWPENEFPFIHRMTCSLEEMVQLERPSPRTDGLSPFVLKRLQHCEPAIRREGHSIRFAVARGPFNIAAFLLGTTEFMMALPMNPDKVHALLGTITAFLVDWIKLQAATFPTIDGIFILDDIIGFVGKSDFEAFVLPYLKQVFGAIDARVRFLHNDAAGLVTAPFLPQIGVNMFNFSYQHTMADMRRLTANQVTLVGNIPPRDVLAGGTPDAVRRSVAALMDGGCDGRRTVLSCGGGLPPGVRTENIQAFLEAAGYRK
jgi:uroporphyrinogen decarboxylase